MKMTWTHALIAGCFTLGLGFTACGDDDDGDKSDTSTTTQTTTATDTAQETVEPVTNACTNADDGAKLQAEGADPNGTAQSCGLSCLSAGDNDAIRTCTVDCMVNGSGDIQGLHLSNNCAGCFADVVICAVNNCIAAPANCATAPDGQPCIECRETNCNPAFYTCSGLPDDSE